VGKKIRKAVFPVAGLGTRFLPATKATPKEMLPIVDKPLVQYAAEEAIAAGIDELVFVTSGSKRAIEDHFDTNHHLETELAKSGKRDLLDSIRAIVPDRVTCVFVRQHEALGLGHAVLCARPVCADEPFAVILPDDLIDTNPSSPSCLTQMITVFEQHRGAVLGVEEVPVTETQKYGIVDYEPLGDRLSKVRGIVEKPHPRDAPSTLGVVGRYILTPAIFHYLESTQRGKGGEIQLTDAIASLLLEEPVLAYRFAGRRFDCGNKLDYVKAIVEFACKDPDIHERFQQYLKTLRC
jgi:UTP--glucose-1-phosphate uridylyltransferase